MSEAVLGAEPAIRLACFVAVFAAMALWEVAAPRRRLDAGRARRWPSNLAIVLLNAAVVRLLLPTAVVGVALAGEARGWGLLPVLGLPDWAAVAISLVLLDLTLYLQHVLFHAVPALWRLHRMHHADLDFDVTTGLRFHPLEIGLSLGLKLAMVAALGAPAVAVLVFEVLLNATSMFNHGNVRMPGAVDRTVRWLLVTPDMHRVHHSIEPSETNANFGFNLSCWDRLCGTYRAQPAAGHAGMTVGITQFRDFDELRLHRMLVQPFRGDAAAYPIGRRKPAGDTRAG